jgi:hypothetical protein
LPRGQRVGQRIGRRDHWQVTDTQCRTHRSRHLRRILDRRQLRQPHPVGEPAGHPSRHLADQPCLPGSAWPGYRHQATLTQLAGDICHRLSPADETGERDREAMYAFRRVRLR